MVLRLTVLLPVDRMGRVEPDQPLARRRVQRLRVVDAVRPLDLRGHARSNRYTSHVGDAQAELASWHNELGAVMISRVVRGLLVLGAAVGEWFVGSGASAGLSSMMRGSVAVLLLAFAVAVVALWPPRPLEHRLGLVKRR